MKPTMLLLALLLLIPAVAAQVDVATPNTFAAWFAGLGAVGVVVAILAFVFWVWMLVDAITRTFTSDLEKVVWILVIIFLNILGALIYYFAVRLPQGKPRLARRVHRG